MKRALFAVVFVGACGGDGPIRFTPEGPLSIAESGLQGNVEIENLGDVRFRVTKLEIKGPNDETSHPSIQDFTLSACNMSVCDVDVELCTTRETGCSFALSFKVEYQNKDASPKDVASLHITTDHPEVPLHRVVIQGGPQ